MSDIFSLAEGPSLLMFDDVDSTNAEITRMIEGGFAAEGDIVYAKSQNKGRGRSDREWYSPAGNFHLSFVLKPEYQLQKATQVSFISAIALIAVLKKYLPNKAKLSCKWPNDILLDGKKLAGILLESKFDHMHEVWLIVGVGINLIAHPDDGIIEATDLIEHGVEPDANNLIFEFLQKFNEIYDIWLEGGFSEIRTIWLENAHGLNEKVQIKPQDKIIEGIFKDMDEEGNLLIEIDGQTRSFNSGEIFFPDSLAKNKVTRLFS